MNIYDEAIEEIKNAWNGNPLTYPKKTIQALERAKKVEELLDIYRLQQEFKERYTTSVTLLDQQECLDNIREIAEEIYLKEKELEELK